jgi:hypothetical protein
MPDPRPNVGADGRYTTTLKAKGRVEPGEVELDEQEPNDEEGGEGQPIYNSDGEIGYRYEE